MKARVVALALLVAPMGVAAEPSARHTVEVSATILARNTCRFTNDGPSRLAFGAIDRSASAEVSFSVNTAVHCTGTDPAVTYRVRSDGGLHGGGGRPRMRHATVAGQYLPYSLDLPPPGSIARNTTRTFTIAGAVAPADSAGAAAGTYSDTVVLTVEP